jgi:limonene-1,2-epoxide hydrolase
MRVNAAQVLAPPSLLRIGIDGKLRLLALAAISSALVAGCGGGSDSDGSDSTLPDATEETDPPAAAPREVPGGADPEAVAVIGAWVDALRSGDVEAAADYFAIPSVAENGPLLAQIASREDAVQFNESLPCGARLIRAESSGEFTTATFRLTERPGAGRCGPGAGETAETAFVIRDGRIVEWRRVGEAAPPAHGEAA